VRRAVTARLNVTGPRYVPIKATVEVSVFKRAIDNGLVTGTAAVVTETTARVTQFLHPTRGGREGQGWQVGQAVFIADLFKAIMPDENVGFISKLAIEPQVPLYHVSGVWNDALERPFTLALGTPGAAVRLADYELVCSSLPPTGHAVTALAID
jgi:hypothetical protein